jgi:hypothetical protein
MVSQAVELRFLAVALLQVADVRGPERLSLEGRSSRGDEAASRTELRLSGQT